MQRPLPLLPLLFYRLPFSPAVFHSVKREEEEIVFRRWSPGCFLPPLGSTDRIFALLLIGDTQTIKRRKWLEAKAEEEGGQSTEAALGLFEGRRKGLQFSDPRILLKPMSD